MTIEDLDRIFDMLNIKSSNKRDVKIAKAQAEIDAIQREYGAYCDGAWDALKAVKEILTKGE